MLSATPAAPEAASRMRSALEGVFVLDLSDGVAGQFAGRILAEHGARVLLVEPADGSGTRHSRRLEDRHLFWHLNTGKRSLVLNRAGAGGQTELEALAAQADMVIGDRGEALSGLRKRHPRLITCLISDFADTGPYAAWKGSEMIHQALSGLMHTTGRADRPPLFGFGYRAYYSAGAAAVTAVVGALLVRLRTGAGQALRISVHETSVSMSQNAVAQYSYNGTGMARGPYPGPFDIFQCKDGWVAMYVRGDRWQAFCEAIGRPELPQDPRFNSIAQLVRNWGLAQPVLAPTLRAFTVDEAIRIVESARGLASRVNTMDDVLNCAHLAARGFWETATTANGEPKPILGPMFRMSATPRRVTGGAPALNDANTGAGRGNHG